MNNNTMTLDVNGKKVEAKKGDTILQALRRAGINVPTLCYLEGLAPSGACRMCVVEVEGFPNLVPSCSYPAADGMKIKTGSPMVLQARRMIIELLLANHPDDCLYCIRDRNCDLQRLAQEHGIARRRFSGGRTKREKDISGPSIQRDPEKCILCGKCVRVCEEVQGVSAIDFVQRGSKSLVGTAFNKGLNVSSCINCGQCILVCPTGALHERSYVDDVLRALNDPETMVVAQHAPAVSVSIAEEFGMKPGVDFDGKMVAALRKIGFDRVFDTSFTADLTIMEEGSELVHRVQTGGVLPMMTSCSPGWIKFVEQFYPEFMPNLSSCKSPQQMMGAVIKTYFAEKEKLDPKKIVSVSIMPCTAKKFECQRPEMGRDFLQDVDYVLTTRELAQLFRIAGINPSDIEPESADTPFGERSSAGKLFGASGGVMEAAIRSAYFLLTGKELEEYKIQDLRGMKGSKELSVQVGDLTLKAVVVSSLQNARKLLDEIKSGRKDIHFIEVMTCPGGCINGGGQPIGVNIEAAKARMNALYQIDRDAKLRVSHKNEYVQRLYAEFLGKPLGERSHKLLHTKYAKRDVML
jgi:iron-only hydrogenase group A